MSEQGTDKPEPERRKKVEYFVNGEAQYTEESKLEVKVILADAGFDPPAEWLLTRDRDGKEFKDEDHKVEIHKDERFTATFTGPTPTS
jgi:hypothetical protein